MGEIINYFLGLIFCSMEGRIVCKNSNKAIHWLARYTFWSFEELRRSVLRQEKFQSTLNFSHVPNLPAAAANTEYLGASLALLPSLSCCPGNCTWCLPLARQGDCQCPGGISAMSSSPASWSSSWTTLRARITQGPSPGYSTGLSNWPSSVPLQDTFWNGCSTNF